MRLALRELVRRPARFVTATLILTVIAILLMFLGGLLDGLIRSTTGAVRAQDADLIVYSDTSQASFLRSRIDPATRAVVEEVPGVSEVGGIGVVQLGARVPGNGPRDLANVALFGYELTPDGVPDPPAPGTAWADEVLRDDGVEEGQTIALGPARSPITVAGFVEDTSYLGQGGLWADPATWRAVLARNRPDARLGPGVFQALVVRVEGASPDEVAVAIDAATGSTETLTVDEAISELPGVEEQQSTFNQIIGVTVVVALVVIALFFALLTVERTALYGVLKALGARSRTLFLGLVVQAVILTAIASAVGAGMVLVIDRLIPPGSIPLYVAPSRLVLSAVLLVLAAIVGCAFSLRRVLRVDPASALGSSS